MVVVERAEQILDAVVCIARSHAGIVRWRVHRHRDACIGRGIGGGVDTQAADQLVSPGAPIQHIIAVAAFEPVGQPAAGNPVVERRTDGIFDVEIGIADRIDANSADRVVQTEFNSFHGVGEIDRIDSSVAAQGVSAGATNQNVVTGTAIKKIGAATAFQTVIAVEAPQDVSACVRAADDVVEG